MAIDNRRFVDINIKHTQISSVSSIRDTAVLLTNDGTAGYSATYSSLEEFEEHVGESTGFTTSKKYVARFFENSGSKLLVVEGVVDTSQALDTAIKNLDNELIVVAYTGNQSHISSVAQTRSQDTSIYGINKKLLLQSTSNAADTSTTEGLICKYSTITNSALDHPEDVMTIAAYLTNIDVYGINTVQDYCFTRETAGTVIDDDELFGTLSANNINVDVRLAGSVRNYGGNCKNGLDLVNEFVLIVLQQTVTDRVILALGDKLKNESGLATIKTVMSEELNRYITNGYLNTSAIWTDSNYVVEYNGQNYTVVEQNTALPLGYRIKILPYSSLSTEDRRLHSTPPIYIALSDSYGIRKVTINGIAF